MCVVVLVVSFINLTTVIHLDNSFTLQADSSCPMIYMWFKLTNRRWQRALRYDNKSASNSLIVFVFVAFPGLCWRQNPTRATLRDAQSHTKIRSVKLRFQSGFDLRQYGFFSPLWCLILSQSFIRLRLKASRNSTSLLISILLLYLRFNPKCACGCSLAYRFSDVQLIKGVFRHRLVGSQLGSHWQRASEAPFLNSRGRWAERCIEAFAPGPFLWMALMSGFHREEGWRNASRWHLCKSLTHRDFHLHTSRCAFHLSSPSCGIVFFE